MSEAEDRRLDYREALERAREEAREVTASELTRQLEDAGYPDQARKIVTFAGLSGCHQETAAAAIGKVTEQLTQIIRSLREGNFSKCALPGLAAGTLPEILKLPTVFFHFVYDVPDGTSDPTNADTWDAADEYHETDEYEPRNQLMAQLMTLLIVGAQSARTLGSPYPTHFISAIQTLRHTSHEKTGTPLEKEDASLVSHELSLGLKELSILARIATPLKDTDTALTVLKDFFTPEDDHYGVSDIWYSEPETTSKAPLSDEDWATSRHDADIGRFHILYEDGYLTLIDTAQGTGDDLEHFTYANLAQQKTVRFEVLIALLRQMEADGGEPKQLIRGSKNSNWRGAFQAGLKSNLPLRFKNEQILRPTAKNGADSPYWRFKTTAEATAYQQHGRRRGTV